MLFKGPICLWWLPVVLSWLYPTIYTYDNNTISFNSSLILKNVWSDAYYIISNQRQESKESKTKNGRPTLGRGRGLTTVTFNWGKHLNCMAITSRCTISILWSTWPRNQQLLEVCGYTVHYPLKIIWWSWSVWSDQQGNHQVSGQKALGDGVVSKHIRFNTREQK